MKASLRGRVRSVARAATVLHPSCIEHGVDPLAKILVIEVASGDAPMGLAWATDLSIEIEAVEEPQS